MSRTKTGLKNGFYSEKTGFCSGKKLVFILNRGLMSKTGFYSEKLVYFIFIISSKTENILSLKLQCINLPTSNNQHATGSTTTLKKKHPINFTTEILNQT